MKTSCDALLDHRAIAERRMGRMVGLLLASWMTLGLTAWSHAAPEDTADAGDHFVSRCQDRIEEVREAYGGTEWAFFHDDFMPRPYLVGVECRYVEDPALVAVDYADILGCLHQEFYREYEELLELTEIRVPVVVLVFENKRSYERCRKANEELELPSSKYMAGYFSPSTGVMTQWHQPDLWSVLFHEGTHQLMHHAMLNRFSSLPEGCPWLQEGIAEYFGGHEAKRENSAEKGRPVREFTLGALLPDHMKTVRYAMKGRYAISLHDLTHLDFVTFKTRQINQDDNGTNQQLTGLVYAEGWALVTFLMQADGGRYRDLFNEYLRAEVSGEGGGEKFGEIFCLEDEYDWQDFDLEFRDWVMANT